MGYLEWVELNVYDYRGFQPKTTHPKHIWGECTCILYSSPDPSAKSKFTNPEFHEILINPIFFTNNRVYFDFTKL